MGSKYLICDWDGVLRPIKSLEYGTIFEDANKQALTWLLEHTNVYIVFSSAWRVTLSPEEFEDILVEHGIPARGRVRGATPLLPEGSTRQDEIDEWLKTAEYDTYLILDDSPDVIDPRTIHCDSEVGLTMQEAHAAVRSLT